MSYQQGYLEIILGPMFSGKTTMLIELYNKYNEKTKNFMNYNSEDNIEIYEDIKVAVINYSKDKRYHETMLSTHDQVMIPCTFADNLNDVINTREIIDADVVLINEGQFFPDLFENVIIMVENMNKNVHVCGLDGDYNRNKFGQLLDLIPYCNNVLKLSSKCSICYHNASFTHRKTDEQEQIVIGTDSYIPLCRGCYNMNVSNKKKQIYEII
jgi:thymidine kinase